MKAARDRFIRSWGEMAPAWGINKTMARIHAHLMTAEKPVSTDEIMKELEISRGNANTNLRALVDWGLTRRVLQGGERREYFASEKDVWSMCCRIARERKRREIEPVIETLEECIEEAGTGKDSAAFRQRMSELLELVRLLDFGLGKLAQQERRSLLPRLVTLLKAMS